MIKSLYIKDFAIINEISIDLKPGLTVLQERQDRVNLFY